jgi:hypothetical protein
MMQHATARVYATNSWHVLDMCCLSSLASQAPPQVGCGQETASSRAHQKPLSTQSLSSSRGGMNPNLDFWGMLRSSMKAISLRPPAGAKTPLVRFSSLPSMVSCHGIQAGYVRKECAMNVSVIWHLKTELTRTRMPLLCIVV